jgi:phage gp45-like
MSKFFNLIKRAVITRKTPDTGQATVAQVSWNNNTADNVESLTPYGYYMNPPVGSTGLMFSVMGQEENRAAIFNKPKIRFKNLEEGEVAIGNPITESVVKFLKNGDIDITCKNDQNVTVSGSVNITVTGDTNITTTGNTTIDSTGNVSSTVGGTLTANVTGNTDITSPIVTINGALNVTGEITAFSGLGGEINFTDIVATYNAHTHISATAGNPSSTPSNTLP